MIRISSKGVEVLPGCAKYYMSETALEELAQGSEARIAFLNDLGRDEVLVNSIRSIEEGTYEDSAQFASKLGILVRRKRPIIPQRLEE